jgi:ribosomal-protein-alanine N-acetyltransferase
MIENLKIRAYHPNDKPKLLGLLKLNVPVYFAESEINDLDEYLENHIEQYFVIEFENSIIGAGGINIEDNNSTGKISWDFIDPKFQGQGAGRKLLAYRIDLLKSIKSIENITVRTSQLTYLFYEKSGFVLKKVAKDYWAKGFDLYEMTYQ